MIPDRPKYNHDICQRNYLRTSGCTASSMSKQWGCKNVQGAQRGCRKHHHRHTWWDRDSGGGSSEISFYERAGCQTAETWDGQFGFPGPNGFENRGDQEQKIQEGESPKSASPRWCKATHCKVSQLIYVCVFFNGNNCFTSCLLSIMTDPYSNIPNSIPHSMSQFQLT